MEKKMFVTKYDYKTEEIEEVLPVKDFEAGDFKIGEAIEKDPTQFDEFGLVKQWHIFVDPADGMVYANEDDHLSERHIHAKKTWEKKHGKNTYKFQAYYDASFDENDDKTIFEEILPVKDFEPGDVKIGFAFKTNCLDDDYDQFGDKKSWDIFVNPVDGTTYASERISNYTLTRKK